MDDPVSALDSNVKRKVFEEVFWSELKHKTRILITHAVDFLHLSDRIVIMEKGAIKLIGTYKELGYSSEIKHAIETISKTYVQVEHQIEDLENISDETHEENNNTISDNYNLDNDIDRIVENENKENIDVGLRTYRQLFVNDCNWSTYLLLIPILVAYSYFGIYSIFYCGIWIKQSQDKSVFWHNFIIVITFSIGYGLSRNIVAFLIYFSTIRMSRLLHERMIKRVVNAPINTYFDKTPSGNILNRFSRDLSKMDEEIYR